MRWKQLRNESGAKILSYARRAEVTAGWFILPEKETDIIIQLSAAGLKRTVRCIPLSEAGGEGRPVQMRIKRRNNMAENMILCSSLGICGCYDPCKKNDTDGFYILAFFWD